MTETPPVKRLPLVDQVLGYLQQQIVSGIYPAGSKLPTEPELMTQLAVGRSTLREAMRVLAHMGLVEVRAGDGTYVRTPSPEAEPLGQRLLRAHIFEVYEARQMLERECVRLAAQRRDEQDLSHIQQAVQKRGQSLGPYQEQEFLAADIEFHIAIAEATKNAVLADLYRAFVGVHRESWSQASEIPGLKEQGQIIHEQLAEAIARQDPEHAQQSIERLLSGATTRFEELLAQEKQTPETR